MHHICIIDTNLTRNEFTRHGIHMNSSGKEKIAKIIRHNITNLLTSQNPPISLKWKEVPSATSTDETKMEFICGNADDVHKNAARTSCRPKRTPITRNEDFLWARYISKTVFMFFNLISYLFIQDDPKQVNTEPMYIEYVNQATHITI